MDSTELNKVLAAFLTAGIVFGMGGLLGGRLVHSERPLQAAFVIEGAMPEAIPAAPKATPIAALLASADPARGSTEAARQCASCHSFGKGGAALVGPNLYGKIDAPIAGAAGYDFSAALKAKPGKWDFEAMNAWLKDPKAYAPGTRMAFAGIASDRQRADVIDYLRTLADTPTALPPVPAASPTVPAASPTVPEQTASGNGPAAAPAPPGPPAFGELVGQADVKQGADVAQTMCGACHGFDKGGGAVVGPNLYDIVGKPIAAGSGFGYSDALKARHGAWSYDTLDAWLADPNAFAPGTMMGFAGIPARKQRAAVVAYLRSLSDKPAPLPAAASGQ